MHKIDFNDEEKLVDCGVMPLNEITYLANDARCQAAALLKAMSQEGIYLANPDSWIGSVPLSTDAPVIDPDKEVIVSPSGAEK